MNSDPMSHRSVNSVKVPIYLNVYNFWPCFNKIFDPMGIGVYHTGIQLYDDQYMFFGFDGDQTGVGYIQPFQAAYEFKEQILLGYTGLTFFEFDDRVLDPLRLEFIGNKYDLLGNNCNHFAKRLSKQLKVEEKFPKKIFRITDFCDLFRCCIPQCILNGRLDWFNPTESSSSRQSNGYYELQESVKDQIDMKMLYEKEKQRQKELYQQLHLQQRKSLGNTPTVQPNTKQDQLRASQQNPHLHDVPKHTTLRKGIWPHLQNAHERASMHSLPHVSPRSIGNESFEFQEQKKPKVQFNQRYPNENIKIYLSDKKKKETYTQQ